MNDQQLQALVEELSLRYFKRPFIHRAYFNRRLKTTGGRYLLMSHDIEINEKMLTKHGKATLIGTIKHELCHYHLHLTGQGYRHRDRILNNYCVRSEVYGMPQLVVRITDTLTVVKSAGKVIYANVKSISNVLSVVAVTESCAF